MIDRDLIVSDDDSLVGLFAFKLGHPWMLADLVDSVPLWRFVIEYFLDQVSGLFWYAVVEGVLSCKNFFVKSIGVLVFKRKVPIEHGEKNDPAGPYINLDTFISFTLNHFRSRITRRTTWRLKQLPFLISVTKPKIHNLQRVIISKQNVFRFEIPMRDINFPHILNTVDKFMEEFPSFVFFNTFILDNVVKELSVLHVLHDEH